MRMTSRFGGTILQMKIIQQKPKQIVKAEFKGGNEWYNVLYNQINLLNFN